MRIRLFQMKKKKYFEFSVEGPSPEYHAEKTLENMIRTDPGVNEENRFSLKCC